MIVLAERVYHRAVGRPGKFAVVVGKFLVEFLVNGGLGLGCRLLDHLVHLGLQGLHLLSLGRQLLLVTGLVFVEAGHQLPGLGFVGFEFLEFSYTGGPQHAGLFAQFLKPRLLFLYLRPGVLYLQRLGIQPTCHLL